jgi:hypothetical protein
MYSLYFEIRHKAKINAIMPIIKLSSLGQNETNTKVYTDIDSKVKV